MHGGQVQSSSAYTGKTSQHLETFHHRSPGMHRPTHGICSAGSTRAVHGASDTQLGCWRMLRHAQLQWRALTIWQAFSFSHLTPNFSRPLPQLSCSEQLRKERWPWRSWEQRASYARHLCSCLLTVLISFMSTAGVRAWTWTLASHTGTGGMKSLSSSVLGQVLSHASAGSLLWHAEDKGSFGCHLSQWGPQTSAREGLELSWWSLGLVTASMMTLWPLWKSVLSPGTGKVGHLWLIYPEALTQASKVPARGSLWKMDNTAQILIGHKGRQ